MLLEDVSASCLCAGMGLANSTPATQYAWDEATQHCLGVRRRRVVGLCGGSDGGLPPLVLLFHEIFED